MAETASDHVARQGAADADGGGAISEDLACCKCGYNLRTLGAAKVCSECGTPVANSLRHTGATTGVRPMFLIIGSVLFLIAPLATTLWDHLAPQISFHWIHNYAARDQFPSAARGCLDVAIRLLSILLIVLGVPIRYRRIHPWRGRLMVLLGVANLLSESVYPVAILVYYDLRTTQLQQAQINAVLNWFNCGTPFFEALFIFQMSLLMSGFAHYSGRPRLAALARWTLLPLVAFGFIDSIIGAVNTTAWYRMAHFGQTTFLDGLTDFLNRYWYTRFLYVVHTIAWWIVIAFHLGLAVVAWMIRRRHLTARPRAEA